ncbi:MAG TPA: metalloprotease family protein, partial [Bacillota bacterium]|nr:metalloprotease family protein [Bacillota bacterium]
YCHCDEVLSIKRYINALWAPLWFLCSLLVVLSLIIDFLPLFLATATLIFGSCGDLYVWLLIRKHRKQNVFVWDMVDEVGCELFFEDDASKVSTTQSTTPSMSE